MSSRKTNQKSAPLEQKAQGASRRIKAKAPRTPQEQQAVPKKAKAAPKKAGRNHENPLLDACFSPNQWTIMGQAYAKVDNLVKSQDGAYRRKLVDLADHSIQELPKKARRGLTADSVVDEAWASVNYCWADSSTDPNLIPDESCAYTTMGKLEGAHLPYFPVIAISSSFRDNDYPAGEGPDPLSEDDKKTLLFLFKKIKHEFLQVVHRFLLIKEKKESKEVGTPERYRPRKQASRRKRGVPEVGDHDEEEDAGGPILPLRLNQKLSGTNPLCVYLEDKYLPLNQEAVEGLLNMDYTVGVATAPHDSILYSVKDCRAFVQGILGMDFYAGEGVAKPASKKKASLKKEMSKKKGSSMKKAGSKASAAAVDTDSDESDVSIELAAWRRNGRVPIEFPASFAHSIRQHNKKSGIDDGQV